MTHLLEQARALFESGEFEAAREAATEGLRSAPDDLELLRIAGRAGVETGSGEAVGQLRRLTELTPDAAEAWHDMGEALATEGRSDEAAEAFRNALDRNPDDEVALTHLGHTEFQTGHGDEGVKLLEQAAERISGNSTADISLVEMYRTLGQPEQALEAAVTVAAGDPTEALYALDVAELSLQVGKLDEATAAFAHLREIVDALKEEVCALHGMILVELEKDDFGRALELARDALAIDTVGQTAGVVAHLEVETGADPATGTPRNASSARLVQGVPPTRQEIDAALRGSMAELRRFHADSNRPLGEELLG